MYGPLSLIHVPLYLFSPLIHPIGDLPSLVTRCNHSHCPSSSLCLFFVSSLTVYTPIYPQLRGYNMAEHEFEPSNAPKRRVKVLQLGILSPDDVREGSCMSKSAYHNGKEIPPGVTKPQTYDGDGQVQALAVSLLFSSRISASLITASLQLRLSLLTASLLWYPLLSSALLSSPPPPACVGRGE